MMVEALLRTLREARIALTGSSDEFLTFSFGEIKKLLTLQKLKINRIGYKPCYD